MNTTLKYVAALVVASTGIVLLWKVPTAPLIGMFLLCLSCLLNPTWKQQGSESKYFSDPKKWLQSLSVLLAFYLGIVLLWRVPETEMYGLFGTWYFSGALWLLMLFLFTSRYLDGREQEQADSKMEKYNAPPR